MHGSQVVQDMPVTSCDSAQTRIARSLHHLRLWGRILRWNVPASSCRASRATCSSDASSSERGSTCCWLRSVASGRGELWLAGDGPLRSFVEKEASERSAYSLPGLRRRGVATGSVPPGRRPRGSVSLRTVGSRRARGTGVRVARDRDRPGRGRRRSPRLRCERLRRPSRVSGRLSHGRCARWQSGRRCAGRRQARATGTRFRRAGSTERRTPSCKAACSAFDTVGHDSHLRERAKLKWRGTRKLGHALALEGDDDRRVWCERHRYKSDSSTYNATASVVEPLRPARRLVAINRRHRGNRGRNGEPAVITGSTGLIGSEAAIYFGGLGLDVVGIDNDMRKVFFGPEASTPGIGPASRRRSAGYVTTTVDIRDRERFSSSSAGTAKPSSS